MIERLRTQEEIGVFLKRLALPRQFFLQAQILHTFLNKEGFELYGLEHKNKSFLFLRKTRTGELRFLFEQFPEKVVSELKELFSPSYIAYNQLFEDPHKDHQIEDTEVVIDIDRFVALDNKRIRKHYRQACKANTSLVFKKIETVPLEDLECFWKEWAQHAAAGKERFSDNTHHDKRFFEINAANSFFGVVAYDGKRVVAYSIGLDQENPYCLSAFNKALRGYTNLGLQISYEKAKIAKELGYRFMNLAWIKNDFKKQFLPIATLLPTYGFELWREQTFQTKTPHGYTSGLLR